MLFRTRKSIILVTAMAVLISFTLISWGKFGHEHINNAAVMALPAPMQAFFYNHMDFMVTEANLPDVRKYTMKDSAEFPRHHIHLESFGDYSAIPKAPKDAYAKYDAAFFKEHGILPWYIQDMMVKLTDAMKNGHKSDMLFLAADLGHYIGDAYMPLHTSVNHNGTLTGQKGIHGLFEARLPEMYGEGYNYHAGPAKYITDIQQEAWRIVAASNHTADTLLKADKELSTGFATPVFEKDDKGKIKTNMYGDYIYTPEYAKALHAKLKGMVERQLRGAIISTASFWYTAWVNAGKPDLTSLDSPALTQRNAKNLLHDKELYKSGKLFGLKSEREF